MKIHLIDERRGYADMLSRVLSENPHISVSATSTELKQTAAGNGDASPDCVLIQLDTLWHQLSAFDDSLRTRLSQARLYVMGDRYSDTQLDTLLHMRVNGLLTSNQPLPQIVHALLSDTSNPQAPYVSPELLDRLEYDTAHRVFHVKRRNALMQLTLRQMDVLIQIARGSSVKEVARRMYLSERAVESHKYRIMQKLDVQDRIELCLFAVREGIIQV